MFFFCGNNATLPPLNGSLIKNPGNTDVNQKKQRYNFMQIIQSVVRDLEGNQLKKQEQLLIPSPRSPLAPRH